MPPRRAKRSQSTKSKRGKKENDKDTAEQKDILLNDFRSVVQKQIGYLQREAETMCNNIRSMYHKEIIQLSKKVRGMTIKEYFEQGGGINGKNVNNVKEEISSVSQNVSSVLSKIEMKQNKENNGNSGNTAQSTRVLRPRKGKATTVRKMTTRTNSKDMKVEVTPYNHQSLLKTPLITPKFDPSLPTPAVLRKPRAGEFIVSMGGSPLLNAPDFENDPGILMSLGSGRVISITNKTTLNRNEIQAMDDATKKSLLAVKEKLNKLLQTPD